MSSQQNTYKYSVQNISTLQVNMWLACGQGIQLHKKCTNKCIIYSESGNVYRM